MTDAQREELKRTRKWLECDIHYKESALRVRRYELHLAIDRSIPEEEKKSIQKDIYGLEVKRMKLQKDFATGKIVLQLANRIQSIPRER